MNLLNALGTAMECLTGPTEMDWAGMDPRINNHNTPPTEMAWDGMGIRIETSTQYQITSHSCEMPLTTLRQHLGDGQILFILIEYTQQTTEQSGWSRESNDLLFYLLFFTYKHIIKK